MYRFLDRPVPSLDPGDQVLVWSMRSWVAAMAMQRCPCATLGPSFARWGVAPLLRDFNLAMFLLNGEGTRPLRFGPPDCTRLRDDEAMLLVLYHAAADHDFAVLGRLAAQLVIPAALPAFTAAVSEVAELLRRTPVPRDFGAA